MKIIIIIIIILSFNLTSYGQWNTDSKYNHDRKIHKYENLKRTGIIITISGAAVICGGIALIATDDNNGGEYMMTNGLVGAAFVVIGSAALITGVIISIVGGKKIKKLDCGFRFDKKMQGLVLAYRF